MNQTDRHHATWHLRLSQGLVASMLAVSFVTMGCHSQEDSARATESGDSADSWQMVAKLNDSTSRSTSATPSLQPNGVYKRSRPGAERLRSKTRSANADNPMSTQLAAAGAHSASDSGEYPTRVPDPPPVIMSAAHRKECKVFQGDAFPSMHVKALDGDSVSVEKLIEEGPTLIVFWKSGHFYSEALIEDLNADGPGNPIAAYSELPIIAIRVGAVGKQSALTNDTLRKHGRVDHYIDEQEEAFAKVGTERFPRAYLLDSNGQITWLDTEYSRSTRRALGIGIRSLMAH